MKFRTVTAFLGVTGINVAVFTLILMVWAWSDLGPRHDNSSPLLEKSHPTHVNVSKAELAGGNSSQKFMFYYCPRTAKDCDGWGDQQRAIVGVFFLARAAGRRFGIISDSPCDLRNFYLPNIYDWDVNLRDLANKKVRIVDKSHLKKVLRSNEDVNTKFPEDVLYTNGGYYHEIVNNTHLKPHLPAWWNSSYWRHFISAWGILMRPSPQLLRRQSAFLRELHFDNRSRPLVSVHVRIGRNPSNPYDTADFNSVQSTSALWKFVRRYVINGSHVFVATDCDQIRQQSRSIFGWAHHDTGGVILHVAMQRYDPRACQGYEDALLDQLILTKGDVLIKSLSGFSRNAGYIRRSFRDIYIFHKGRVARSKICHDSTC